MHQHYPFHNSFLWQDMNNKAIHVCLEKCWVCIQHLQCRKVNFYFPLFYHTETVIFLVIVRENEISQSPAVVWLWIPVRIWERHSLRAVPHFLCARWTALYHRSDKAAAFPPPPWPGQTAALHPQTLPSTSASGFSNVGLAARCSVWTWWRMQIREACCDWAV